MKSTDNEACNIPFDYPFYPSLPAHYRGVRLQFIFFVADRSAVTRILPEPLVPARDSQCVACGLDVPFCSNYGPFQESWVSQKCVFRGKTGWYRSHVFHNGPAGIAAGREIYGTPKVFATMNVRFSDRNMVTRTAVGDLPVMTTASTMQEHCDVDQMPVLAPSWRLKLICRADGPEPAIKQLIDGAESVKEKKVHVLTKGTGTVQFQPNRLCDLTGLQPREYLDAFYMETDFTEGFARIEYDYLAEGL